MAEDDLLGAAFPFHLVAGPGPDDVPLVVSFGRSLDRVCPGISVGDRLDHHLEMQPPPGEPSTVAWLRGSGGKLLVMQARQTDVRIRVQVVASSDPADATLRLLVQPWLGNAEDMGRVGFQLTDFAAFDPTPDYLFMSQQQTIALQDARRLTDRLRSLERRRRHESHHDSLTGLPNRRQLAERIAETAGGSALLYVDIDQFKIINDAYGIGSGDAVLGSLAARLSAMAPPEALVARIGGDEFAILLQPGGLIAPDEVARRLQQVATVPVPGLRGPIHVTVSVGVAVSADPATLTRDADIALHAAKRRGHGRMVVFDPIAHAPFTMRTEFQERLVSAVSEGRIDVVYQPIMSAVAPRVVGFEALARWDDPELGPIPPDTFIPLAEELGIIGDLDRHVLQRAAATHRDWSERLPEVSLVMSVNLSPRQLIDPTLVPLVGDLLIGEGMSAGCLQLEITESELTDRDRSLRTLRELRAMDVRLAIDDFGSSESTLARLHELPVNTLKIDKAFLRGWSESAEQVRRLLSAVVAIAEALDMETVAEGVETEEHARAIRAAGCTYGQGYLWSRPMTADDALDFTAMSLRIPVPAQRKVSAPAALSLPPITD